MRSYFIGKVVAKVNEYFRDLAMQTAFKLLKYFLICSINDLKNSVLPNTLGGFVSFLIKL